MLFILSAVVFVFIGLGIVALICSVPKKNIIGEPVIININYQKKDYAGCSFGWKWTPEHGEALRNPVRIYSKRMYRPNEAYSQ